MHEFSTDASVYEFFPSNLVSPINQKQLLQAVQVSIENYQWITIRVGGTSLGGQAIGNSTLIDISKCLSNIIEFHQEKIKL